ncbi:P-loop containing nucleoside triphosphate hydrolase protein [Desarmillaria tabescens]|uniref:ATP-dependent RNA helicase n=1 Tax=Armillaria tabescens TaxID=1929756 RepID=A0AA39J612_ARMTA|nr:P-loop containing nucleoside triphosphate hydrolase protein [Desarmillaria tabescens]KAK0436319.1 P-loop containing nucleoside triphosphate hydrolase protein [Desarmillaria tabescens]
MAPPGTSRPSGIPGFKTNAVQEEVLDHAKPYDPESTSSCDLPVRERTDTGKTLAFLVSIIETRGFDNVLPSKPHLVGQAAKNWAQANVGAIIISPTRELTTHIAKEALRLSYQHKGFQVRLLVGGVNESVQLRNWAKGRLNIVVATPGCIRIRDIVNSEPRYCKGFEDNSYFDTLIVPLIPEHQTLFLSATLTPAIRRVACEALDKDYKYINCVDDSTPTHLSLP